MATQGVSFKHGTQVFAVCPWSFDIGDDQQLQYSHVFYLKAPGELRQGNVHMLELSLYTEQQNHTIIVNNLTFELWIWFLLVKCG